ncbi:MAG TPA: DMT family transporter, partial [Gemmatimonadaceae bacterium]|nr:DMT family transporter [Gemmatimonadaceae bacterium]
MASSSGRATLLVALSACAFASIPIFVTLAVCSGTPLVDVLVGRYGLAAVLLAGVAVATGTRRIERDGLRVLLIVGAMQAAVAYTSLLALDYIPAGTLSFLFYTYPAWIAIFARLRHSEPLTPVRLLALALSLGGVLTMVGAPTAARLHPAGVALALTSAVLYAVYVPLIARLQRGLAPAVTAGYMAGGAAVVFFLAKAMSGGPAMHFTPVGAWAV